MKQFVKRMGKSMCAGLCVNFVKNSGPHTKLQRSPKLSAGKWSPSLTVEEEEVIGLLERSCVSILAATPSRIDISFQSKFNVNLVKFEDGHYLL